MKHFNKSSASLLDESADSNSSLATEWLTTKQAADYLGVPVGTLRNMTSNGKVPYYKFGRLNRYRLSELRRLLLVQKRGGSHGL